MNKENVGSNPIFHTTVREKICYLKIFIVFLHRNQNLILFINEVNYFYRELGKRFHETYNVHKCTVHKPIWITP